MFFHPRWWIDGMRDILQFSVNASPQTALFFMHNLIYVLSHEITYCFIFQFFWFFSDFFGLFLILVKLFGQMCIQEGEVQLSQILMLCCRQYNRLQSEWTHFDIIWNIYNKIINLYILLIACQGIAFSFHGECNAS